MPESVEREDAEVVQLALAPIHSPGRISVQAAKGEVTSTRH